MENNKRDILKLFFIFLGIPLIGFTLYSGNNGTLYGYYLTGYFLIIILAISFTSSYVWKYKFGKLIIILFILLFLRNNLIQTMNKLKTDVLNSREIVLQNQLIAINWIKEDAKNDKFNIDIYVPPVISHSYNYLLLWNNIVQDENESELLYTLYEDDPPHPERLEAWLNRQKGIGKVIYEERFGGIVVQRRERI
jgi:4-amino-4-deoxy-L-arabinose transferase-like glycosyltransferase